MLFMDGSTVASVSTDPPMIPARCHEVCPDAWRGFFAFLTAIMALAALTLLFSSGCGSDEPRVRLSEIAVAPGLVVYEGPQELVLDNALIAAQSAFEVDAGRAETQFFLMPADMAWEQLEQFYLDKLADEGWDRDKELSGGMTRWTRESASGRQVLVLASVPATAAGAVEAGAIATGAAQGDENLLIVILVT